MIFIVLHRLGDPEIYAPISPLSDPASTHNKNDELCTRLNMIYTAVSVVRTRTYRIGHQHNNILDIQYYHNI